MRLLILAKWLLLFLILLQAALYDIRTLKVKGMVPIIIFFLGFIGMSWDWFWQEGFLGLVFLPLPFIIANKITNLRRGRNGMGIGDIKIIAATGFVLGITYGIIGVSFSLASVGLVMMGERLFNKIKKTNRKNCFPFVPYLTFGFTLSLVLKLLNGGL